MKSNVEIWTFSDPIAVPDGMQVIDQDVISLSEKPFTAKRVMIRLDNAIVLYHRTSHRLKTHTSIDPELMAFVAVSPKSSGTIDGLAMQPGQLIMVEPGSAADMVVNGNYSSVTFLIPPSEITTQIAARRPGLEFRPPVGVDANSAGGDGVAAFFELGHKLARIAERYPDVFDHGRATRLASQIDLVEHLLAILESQFASTPEPRDRTRANYSLIISAAEQYALSHVDDRIYVADLCAAAGVSERTLQLAFQDIMRITPIAYLSRVRLHRARASLHAATPKSATVSTIAMDWGFWHFGEFSKAYKACFHETPSQTLRGRPGE